MKHARRNLDLRAADMAALDYARQLQASLNGARLEGGGGSGGDGGGGDDGGSGGDDGGDDDGGSGSGSGGSDDDGGRGYPENTPVAEMTHQQQAAYWRHQSRKHEKRATDRSDYADVKAKADQWDEHQKSKQSEEDKIRSAAIEEGRNQARHDAALKLVDARIEAAAAGRLDAEQLKNAVQFLDRAQFLSEDDEVDADKVVAFVSSIAPGTGTKGGSGRHPDLGQGRRSGGSGGPSAKEKGLEEARRRFGDGK